MSRPKIDEIKLETITPLWTGNADRKCDRIQATGLIGSLRWWYEVIVRGLGGWACDPSKSECHYDANKPHGGICDACRVFGATGWKRRFGLLVRSDVNSETRNREVCATDNRPSRRDRNRNSVWYFPPGQAGNLTLRFQVAPDLPIEVLLGLLHLIERHGALGAKAQVGYGLIKVASAPTFDKGAFLKHFEKMSDPHNMGIGLPALDEFVFIASFKPGPTVSAGQVETIVNIKYDLRKTFRLNNLFSLTNDQPQALRHFIFGKEVPEKNRQACKIWISRHLNGLCRIWIWVPNDLHIEPPGVSVQRDKVVNEILSQLNALGTVGSPIQIDSVNGETKQDFLKRLVS